MSSSRSAQSGLGSLKRDFSATGSASQPKSSQDLPYDLHAKPAPVKKTRMQLIQEALDAKNQQQLAGSRATAPDTSRSFNKRPSATQLFSSQPTAKKPRLNDPLGGASMRPSSSSQVPPTFKAAPPKPRGKIKLSEEQTKILELVKQDTSVFYTGSAGTGKSVLLREIIKTLRKHHARFPDAVAVTASTGIAACNIGGTTIHSFAGIGLGQGTAEELLKRIMKNKKASTRWMRTKVLIIDEVSMVDADLFDKLSQIGALMRKSPRPFGGIQVIVTGDFFQLPPVNKSGAKFAFEAQIWNQAIQKSFNLTQVFRQSDQEFIDMLNEMRFGQLSQSSIVKFKSLSRNIDYNDGIGPTELFPRREDVERSNTARMKGLGTQDHIYTAFDGGVLPDPDHREKLLANFMAPKQLVLRKDAQVMLIKNMDEGVLANGTMGRVIDFVDPTTHAGGAALDKNDKTKPKPSAGEKWPIVQFVLADGSQREMLMARESWKVELPNGEIQVSRSQFPLILAWAMSIHKSQGQTLDRVKVDLGRIFEKGQAYVALSRATSLRGLQVLNFDHTKVLAHPKVIEWTKTLLTVE